ncbi:MAG: hypothetical protein IT163_16575 [Bryobacterales bacterium]|nr:hypothetical protein [Bryobacterales bacterium]
MNLCDPFGDLREWSRVLDQLKQIRDSGTLNQNQCGLARLVRYPFNPRLRQAGLQAIVKLDTPADAVLLAAARILADVSADIHLRLLAGAAVSHVLAAECAATGEASRAEAAEAIGGALATPQHPALHSAAHRWRDVLRRAEARRITLQEGDRYHAHERHDTHDRYDHPGRQTTVNRGRDGQARSTVAEPLRQGAPV